MACTVCMVETPTESLDDISQTSDHETIPQVKTLHNVELKKKGKLIFPKGHSSLKNDECVFYNRVLDKKTTAVFSIIGESNTYMSSQKIEDELKNGLIEILNTTNIWIITEGKESAAQTTVKEAIKRADDTAEHCKFPVKIRLPDKTENEKDNLQRNLNTCTSKSFSNNKPIQKENVKALDHAKESVIEECIMDHFGIPLIMVIIGGKLNSFKTAMWSLRKGCNILVIDESGGAANFICKGYKLHNLRKSDKHSLFSKTTIAEREKTLQQLGCDCKPDDVTHLKKLEKELQAVLHYRRKLIHVHDLSETSKTLSMTIQDVFLQLFCNEGPVFHQENGTSNTNTLLQLVNLWDRPELARQEIFNLEKIEIVQELQGQLGKKDSALAHLFKQSLLKNRVDFVKQVLEYVLDRDQYKQFVINYLDTLYCDMSNCSTAGSVICELLPKQKKKKNYKEFVDDINRVIVKLLGTNVSDPFNISTTYDKAGVCKDDAFKHLFIWAVLMDQRPIAMLFWRKDTNYLCSALYASSLTSKFSKNACLQSHRDLKTELMVSSVRYEDLAYDVMTELYRMDKTKARQLLVTEVEIYHPSTIFEIAEMYSCVRFMGHTACQTKLNEIWKGGIKSFTSNFMTIMAAFFPFLIKYVTESTHNKVWHQEGNETSSQSSVPWQKNIYDFYNSPQIKFLFFVMSYMIMLVIFCMFILTDLHPISEKRPSVLEYIVYVWALSTMIEDLLRQSFILKKVSLTEMNWYSFWIVFEILMYSLFITSVVLRFSLSSDNFHSARFVYAITLGMFIINSIKFFIVSRRIGPKVIMIGIMMYDILFFVLIFAVFVFGFGVVFQATMFPNSTPGFQLFKDIVYMPYWQLYGELFLDQFEGTEPSPCTNDEILYQNGTIARCPEVNQIHTFLLALYMVLTHIILVNVVIAMFSHTYTVLQDINELIWKYYRFSLVTEYTHRSPWVPPFNILTHLKTALKYLFSQCENTRINKFNQKRSSGENEILTYLEKEAVHRYFDSSRSKPSIPEEDNAWYAPGGNQDTNSLLLDRLESLSCDVDLIKKHQKKLLRDVQTKKKLKDTGC